eukprot:TRINITY_DN19837_c0_g2_i2.p1 TRINITY_DN19837_c0_g2~~TRINITY_DN19837_c0_g2_i2.p1  ORF type:complete len:472 (+),score=93.85 TRINITY_DN19837_c0_g2_i2:1224-2639(+)
MGLVLPKPVTTKVVERRGNACFRVGVSCMNGMRERMEDDHSIELHNEWGFFGVFDGHVGPACSKFMAKRFPESLRNMSIPISDEKLSQLSLDLDREFLDTASVDGSTGTYFIARPIGEGRFALQVGNVGDSRVIVGKGGVAHPMTNDHKPSNDDERVRIEAAGGHVSNCRVDGKLAVSRAYGDAEYKAGSDATKTKVIAVPEVTHTECGPADFVLLSCDGVFESNFTNEEVVEFIHNKLKTTNDLAEVASAVCDEALERGSRDNISAMIVQFTDGSDYASLPQHKDIILGPYSAPESSAFSTAYKAMLEPFQMKISDAIELRYDYAQELLQKRIEATKTTETTCDLTTLDDSDLRKLALRLTGDMLGTPTYASLIPMSRTDLIERIKKYESCGGHRITPVDIVELQEEIENYRLEDGSRPPAKGAPDRKEWFKKWQQQEEAKAKASQSTPGLSLQLLSQLLGRGADDRGGL